MEYVYLGDRNTTASLKNAVKWKCIHGKRGLMLITFGNGKKHIITERLLRKNVPPQ